MRDCENALWPCAMTGAVSCLAGIDGIGTVIHGPSGCYFYPATILHREIHCTSLIEEDIICGTGEQLRDLVTTIRPRYPLLAVVNTCTPAIIGEDFSALIPPDVLMVDSPGFLGTFEDGYRAAVDMLPVKIDPCSTGVNLDGVNLLDPFSPGNVIEAHRILSDAGVTVSATFCSGKLEDLSRASPVRAGTNPDLCSGWGEAAGSLLGLRATQDTLAALDRRFPGVDPGVFEREMETVREAIAVACGKYLNRYEPPSVAIFSWSGYAEFAAMMLHDYLDAAITVVGSRNRVGISKFRTAEASSLPVVEDLLARDPPDLVLGSSFEQRLCPAAAFVPFTYPLRGMVRLRARPLIGSQGLLGLMEDILNACRDHVPGRPGGY